MTRRRNRRHTGRRHGSQPRKVTRGRDTIRKWAVPAIAAAGLATYWAVSSLRPTRRVEPPVPSDPAHRATLERGAALYAEHCASCHGARLEGQPNWSRRLPDGSYPAPPHDETGHTWHHPDSWLFSIVKRGGADSAPRGFPSKMPAFGEKLADTDIWMVLEFIKTTWPEKIRREQERIDRTGSH